MTWTDFTSLDMIWFNFISADLIELIQKSSSVLPCTWSICTYEINSYSNGK